MPTPRGFIDRALATIERVGNALPHPASLFAMLAALVVLASALAAAAGLVVIHPGTDPRAGIGTVIATMLPYTLVFLACWSVLLAAWMAAGLPVGPGAGLRLAP